MTLSITNETNSISLNTNATGWVIDDLAFPNRAAFVTWNATATKAVGLNVTVEGCTSRYIGTGTAISDLPGWVTNTPYYKSRTELTAATVQGDVNYIQIKDRFYIRDTSGTAITSNAGAVKWSPVVNASPVDWGGVANATDNTTALVAWASWLATATVALEGFLPSGEWKYTTPLSFSGVRSRVIRGVGGNIIGNGSRLSYTGTNSDPSIVGSFSVTSCLHYEFQNICFIQRGTGTSYHVAVNASVSPALSSHFIKFRQCTFMDATGATMGYGGVLASSSKFVEFDSCQFNYITQDYGLICGEDNNNTIISGQLALSTVKNCLFLNDIGLYRVVDLVIENCGFETKAKDGGSGCIVPLGELRSSNITIRNNSFIDDGAKTETRAAITTSSYAGTVTLAAGAGWIIDGNQFRNRKTGIHVKGGCRISSNAFMQRTTPTPSVGIRLDSALTAVDIVQIDASNDFSMAILNGKTPIEDNRSVKFATYRAFATRAMAVAYIAANTPTIGTVVSFAGVSVRYIGSGTVISDMPGYVPEGGVAYPDHYADNTTPGTTDMTTALQSAVTNNRVVRGLPGSTYLVKGVCTIATDGADIDFRGCTVTATGWDVGDAIQSFPTGLFNVQGTLGRAGLMTGSAAAGATTITLATPVTAVAPGDGLYMIGANTQWYTEGSTVVPYSFVTSVVSISGTTVTLAEPLPFAFNSATGNVTVTTWKGLKGVSVRLGTVIGPGYVRARANGAGEHALTAIYCRDVTLTAEHIEGFQGHSIYSQRCLGVIQGGHVQGWPDTYSATSVEGDNSFFAGFWAIECAHVQIAGSAHRTRHGIDGTRSRDVSVTTKVWDTHQSAYTTHWGCTDWTFSGIQYRGLPSTQGVLLWRGFDLRLQDSVLESTDTSPAFYDGTGATSDLGRNYTISNTTLISAGPAMQINAWVDSLKASNLKVSGGGSAGTPPVQINTPYLKDLDFQASTVDAVSSNYAIDTNASPVTIRDWRIKNNNINGYAVRAVRAYAETSQTMLDFSANMLRPTGTPGDHLTATGTFLHLVNGPNLCADGKIHAPVTEWFPVLSDGTNDATMAAATKGWWRREGPLVYFSARVSISAIGSVSGAVRIKGLPFTELVTLGNASGTFAVANASGLAITAGNTVTAFMVSNTNYIQLQVFSATTGTSSMTATQWGSAGSLMISGSFLVA